MEDYVYLCDPKKNEKCNRDICGLCKHTEHREFSKHWTDREPTYKDREFFFKEKNGDYWEVG